MWQAFSAVNFPVNDDEIRENYEFFVAQQGMDSELELSVACRSAAQAVTCHATHF